LLDGLMRGDAPAERVVRIPPRPLVVRQSSDATAVAHPGVARAVRFLRGNLHRKALWVPEVAAAVGMSRRGLDRAFRQYLGRSVAQEIRRLRLEEAVELLRTTDLPVGDVADACGYGDAKQFRRALRAITGQTPRDYRRNPAGPGTPPSPGLV
jgi:LacI family transcriptional regulator